MAQSITVSDRVYALIKAAAEARDATPEEVIAVIAQTLIEQEQQPIPAEPMNEAEFAALLGINGPGELVDLDIEAKQRYPEAFKKG